MLFTKSNTFTYFGEDLKLPWIFEAIEKKIQIKENTLEKIKNLTIG